MPASADPAKGPFTREVWAGADVSSDVWLLYTGATVAITGGIHNDGWRMRAVTGYGEFSYAGYLHLSQPIPKTFDATTAFADVLVGYLWRLDSLTVKAFAGVTLIDHEIAPFDPENISIGGEWGAKGVLEFWYNSGPRSWSSLDLSYATAHDTASMHIRSGYRFWPQLSLGVEGAFNIDGQAQCKMRLPSETGCRLDPGDKDVKSPFDFGRTGLFARYDWTGGEVSVSAGALGQVLSSDGRINFDPYVTANWIVQF